MNQNVSMIAKHVIWWRQ